MASSSAPTLLRAAARPLLSSSAAFSSASTAAAPSQIARHALLARASPLRAAYGRQQWGRRWQSSSAGAGPQPSWFQRMWDSPIGFKTVHFWAPVMKWALVLAGIADLARPAEKLSLQQNGALTATGIIWTRWCLIIKPKNYLLAAVNFFLGLVGVAQCARILAYRRSLKNKSVVEQVEDKVKSTV